jgi:predicted nucleotidyltransferase component of viral defense system
MDFPTPPSLATAPEFEDLVRATAEHLGILPALVRKDYWVTRVLRAVATDPSRQGRVLFKGGTSLSKGWQLVDRFSEDIDLLLTGADFGPMPGKGERTRYLKSIRPRIEYETPLRLPDLDALPPAERTFHYVRDDLHVNVRFALPGRSAARGGPSTDWLLVEAGFRGGSNPHATRPITSLIADFMGTQPIALAQLREYDDDLTPFAMELLKPERTLAEKLLALHVDMLNGVEGARRVRTRHSYDVVQLFDKSTDAAASLTSGELPMLIREAARVSNEHWDTHLDPDTLDLAGSPALHPTDEQIRVLTTNYENPLERALYFRNWVPFSQLLARVHALAEALAK